MSATPPTWTDDCAPQDLLGRGVRDLRLSVIDRCNYRCPYCMPEEIYGENYRFLSRKDWLTAGEIRRVAQVFTRLGVDKIRITGGEPLLRKDIATVVGHLQELVGVTDLALTTNGTRLASQAEALRQAGLTRVTVSLDSLDAEVFAAMSGGRGAVADVLAGIDAAKAAGLAPIKINVVVQRGRNDHTVLELLEHFRGSGHIVRFIEFMDVGTLNRWELKQVVTSQQLRDQIHERWPLQPLTQNYRGEVATRYAFEDGAGEVGFISSVSEPFCGDCHRARLAADGTLYTCLFADTGINLRDPLRAGATDSELTGLIQRTWRQREDRYSELRSGDAGERPLKRVEMYRMGG
jgi:cyclic pyranopterin phosphate synthase